MAEGITYAVFVNRGGGIVGFLLQGVKGVSHCHADAGPADHRTVVATVAESDGVLGIKAQMPRHIQNTFTLVGTEGGDVGEGRMPTA